MSIGHNHYHHRLGRVYGFTRSNGSKSASLALPNVLELDLRASCILEAPVIADAFTVVEQSGPRQLARFFFVRGSTFELIG